MTMMQRRVYTKIEQVSSQGPDKPFYNHVIPSQPLDKLLLTGKECLLLVTSVTLLEFFLKGVPQIGRPHIEQSKNAGV